MAEGGARTGKREAGDGSGGGWGTRAGGDGACGGVPLERYVRVRSLERCRSIRGAVQARCIDDVDRQSDGKELLVTSNTGVENGEVLYLMIP